MRANDSGSMCRPVSKASSPSTIDRNSGIVKNTPLDTRYCVMSTPSPARSRRLVRSSGLKRGAWPRACRCSSQATSDHSTARPPPTSQAVSEIPASWGVAASPLGTLGAIHPHDDDCSTPSTIMPSPTAERTAPTTSSFTRSGTSTSGTLLDPRKIPPAMSTSAANTHRQLKLAVTKPPMIGPAATATAAAAAITPYAFARAWPSNDPATRAVTVGMISAAPRPSRTDHPMKSTSTFGAIAVSPEPAA